MVIELTRKSKENLTQVLNRGDVFLNFLVYEHKNFLKSLDLRMMDSMTLNHFILKLGQETASLKNRTFFQIENKVFLLVTSLKRKRAIQPSYSLLIHDNVHHSSS